MIIARNETVQAIMRVEGSVSMKATNMVKHVQSTLEYFAQEKKK